MRSKNEFLDESSYLKEDKIIPKLEPIIDIDFIEEEGELDVEYFIFPGKIDSLEFGKVFVKEELCRDKEIENYSPKKV